jgi:chemotaxis receptor (MCP) glutamine deamidase CheD
VRTGEVTLSIGGVFASGQPMVVKTLLGSCIAVCLHDAARGVGGMNHFMLPRGNGDGDDAGRFGVHAMDLLIGAIMKAGGDRRRLVAKVFGGANLLDVQGPVVDIPRQNVEFVRTFLEEEGIPIVSTDVGGRHARQVHFHTQAGRAFVKRVRRVRAQVRAEEQSRAAAAGTYGGITLFE